VIRIERACEDNRGKYVYPRDDVRFEAVRVIRERSVTTAAAKGGAVRTPEDTSAHSILRIAVREGAEDEFARAFRDLQVFRHASGIAGFRNGRLFRPLTNGEPFVVVAEWDDARAYDAWLEAPVREELGREIEPLLAADMSGGVYVVAEEWRPS
jgi:heme-degrading monooxygenase HmoA